MGHFIIDREKKYLVYGAGGDGMKLGRRLEAAGYRLLGYIDMRAAVLGNVRGKPVWAPDALDALAAEAESIVVVIAIKNVFEHTEIAEKLAAAGFRQCVYKPLPVLQGRGDPELEKVGGAYDAFVVDGMAPEGQELSGYETSRQFYCRDRLLIREEERGDGENEALAWVPVENLYNYEDGKDYPGISMPAFFPLTGLYRLLLGRQVENLDEVVEDFLCYSSEWARRIGVVVDDSLKASLLRSRGGIFQHMESIAEWDFDFFKRSAPAVALADKGKFHMVQSGRNRIVFLIEKQFRYAPVRMSASDYEKWLNREAFQDLKEFLEAGRIAKMPVPVPHPWMQDMPAEFVDYYRLVCFPIAEYLMKRIYRGARISVDGYRVTDFSETGKAIRGCRVVCGLGDNGAMSRYLNAMGFCTARLDEEDGGRLSVLLDRLFYQRIESAGAGEDEEPADLVIIDESGAKKAGKFLSDSTEAVIYIGPEKEEREDLRGGGRTGPPAVLSRFWRRGEMDSVRVFRRRKKVIIFGCGAVGVKARSILEKEGFQAVGFADNGEKWREGGRFEGLPVIPPDEIRGSGFDCVAVGVFKAAPAIKRQLLSMGIPEERILIPIEPRRIFDNPGGCEEETLWGEGEIRSENTRSYERLNVRITDRPFLDKLEDLKRVLSENHIPRGKVCVVGGAVLQALGLRESKEFDDIDIIMTGDLRKLYGSGLVIVSETAEMHPQDQYGVCDDDIIRDAENHFIFNELKFVHPGILCEYVKERDSKEYGLLRETAVKFPPPGKDADGGRGA